MRIPCRFRSAYAAALLFPAALLAGLFPQPVRPVLEYVTDNPDGTYTAWFGYDNLNATAVSIPVGPNNKFSPAPQDRGQPTTFQPGRHASVFSVTFAHGHPAWKLDDETVAAGKNQKPTVTLTSPLNGLTLTAPGTVNLAATASDADGTIAKVEFHQNGVKIAELTAPPYQYTVSNLAAGSYAFRARAVDNRHAPGFSATVTVTVVGGNQPPTVSLTAPADGAAFAVGTPITITADAADSDGTVAKVEFYAGLVKLGEDTTAPWSFTWTTASAGTHTLTARATDNAGATANSAARTITVEAGSSVLPFLSNFEPGEGYVPGSLSAQNGWSVLGSASVVTTPVFDGFQAVAVPGASPPAVVAHDFTAGSPAVTFVDYFARPVAGSTPDLSVIFQTSAGKVALAGASPATLYVFAGNGSGGGVWQATPAMSALEAGGVTVDWVRLTTREDYATKTWDLYHDSRLVAYDIPFVDNSAGSLVRFSLSGHTATTAHFDDFLAAFDNPVFADADKDGMADAWEATYGLNPALNDRNGDPDADTLPNILEFLLGTNPNSTDTDGDGLPDKWERQYGLNPLANDANADADGDGVSNLIEFLQGRNPTKGAVPDTTGAINLRVYQPQP
jgi:hypothetical protein